MRQHVVAAITGSLFESASYGIPLEDAVANWHGRTGECLALLDWDWAEHDEVEAAVPGARLLIESAEARRAAYIGSLVESGWYKHALANA